MPMAPQKLSPVLNRVKLFPSFHHKSESGAPAYTVDALEAPHVEARGWWDCLGVDFPRMKGRVLELWQRRFGVRSEAEEHVLLGG